MRRRYTSPPFQSQAVAVLQARTSPHDERVALVTLSPCLLSRAVGHREEMRDARTLRFRVFASAARVHAGAHPRARAQQSAAPAPARPSGRAKCNRVPAWGAVEPSSPPHKSEDSRLRKRDEQFPEQFRQPLNRAALRCGQPVQVRTPAPNSRNKFARLLRVLEPCARARLNLRRTVGPRRSRMTWKCQSVPRAHMLKPRRRGRI
jgi:hypothetical protein